MKLRTWLLVACMVIVPALAMFSHWVPADVRRTIRSQARLCLERVVAAVTPQPTAVSVAASRAESPAEAPADTRNEGPAASPAESAAASPARSPAPATAAIAAVPTAPGVALAEPTAAEPRTVLRGVAVDCRPVGDGSVHVASCRVAIDSTGQLHRVFQAAGPTPDGAVAALEEAVSAWQRRLADRTAPRPGGL